MTHEPSLASFLRTTTIWWWTNRRGFPPRALALRAGEGSDEFLRRREPRVGLAGDPSAALDKETSGKSIGVSENPGGQNRSLSRQFEARQVKKVYLMETDR